MAEVNKNKRNKLAHVTHKNIYDKNETTCALKKTLHCNQDEPRGEHIWLSWGQQQQQQQQYQQQQQQQHY